MFSIVVTFSIIVVTFLMLIVSELNGRLKKAVEYVF